MIQYAPRLRSVGRSSAGSEAGVARSSAKTAAEIHRLINPNHTLLLDEPIEARYVKFAAKASRFLVISEVQVLDGVKSEPFDLRIALPKTE